MDRWIFLLFLLIVAGQDLRKKRVEVWIFIVFGVGALLILAYQWGTAGQPVPWGNRFSSMCLGFGLLGCSILWQDAIGLGDGCFFLVSGLMLGFWENLALLCYGLLLCSVYCLGLFVWNQVRYHKNVKNCTVPFLPFLVPVGIWIVYR